MKNFFVRSLSFGILASLSAFAQQSNYPTGGSGVTITTVSGLASVPGKVKGTIAGVTNGNSASDCTVGGGSNVVTCQYDGSAWAANGSYTLPAATSSTLGGVEPDGTSILNTAGAISATPASIGAASAPQNAATITSTGALPDYTHTFFRVTCASCTVTLGATPPTGYSVAIQAAGSGTVTINPNGVPLYVETYGTAISTLSVPAGQTVAIFWDGTNYRATAPFVAGTNCTVTPGATGNVVSCVTVSASDLTTGTLPHAQLPTLLSGDIPDNAANTSGTAANLSGTPTLPAGTVLPGYALLTPQAIDCHTACSPTAAQLSNALVSNYGQAASNVQITGPTVAAGMNFIMIAGTAQGANYWRFTSTTANIYLDGGASAVTNIIFATPGIGNSFSCVSFQTGSSTYSLKCTTLAGTSTSS